VSQPFVQAYKIWSSTLGHLDLGVKKQIPKTKLQINLKFQSSMTKTLKDETFFGFSNFAHWDLFVI